MSLFLFVFFSKMTQEDYIGIIPRTVAGIFSGLSDDASVVKVSFFEIHNEMIYDLLNVQKRKIPLRLKEEGSEFTIPGLIQTVVRTSEEAMAHLERGCLTRSTGATAQNAQSSRSHAIFRLTVSHPGHAGDQKISLVDLAGSESAGKAHTEGERRTEGVNINKSLSVLNRCFTAICDREKHVPFRDSNLTKVLRECLVDTGVTAMIACVSPTELDLRETVNTLR